MEVKSSGPVLPHSPSPGKKCVQAMVKSCMAPIWVQQHRPPVLAPDVSLNSGPEQQIPGAGSWPAERAGTRPSASCPWTLAPLSTWYWTSVTKVCINTLKGPVMPVCLPHSPSPGKKCVQAMVKSCMAPIWIQQHRPPVLAPDVSVNSGPEQQIPGAGSPVLVHPL